MAYDRNLLKIAEVPAFRAFLEANGIACRDGKGEFQLLQAHTTPQCWAVINRNAQGELTTHPELKQYIKTFRAMGRRLDAPALAKPAPEPRDTFLEDLRDDLAMAALTGMLANPNLLQLHPQTGRVIGPKTAENALREAYRFADTGMVIRGERTEPTPERAPRKSDDWSADWKANGFNGCMRQAAKALRYLANNERPIGGQESFNLEHLLQIAEELELTQKELLAP